MNETPSQQDTPKATLGKATTIIFHIASGSHTLRRFMGIEITEDGPLGSRKIRYENIHRAWLVKRYADSMELNFDPDLFFKLNRNCSDGEFYMVLFLLNVWNPSYAATKKHKFDLFAALNSLDEGNRQAICDWLQHPIWP